MTKDNNKTRNKIIQTADQLFYQKGFENTSFSDIAKEVNISRGNFYYHFKTKDEILHEVIEYRLKKTRELLVSWENQSDLPDQRIKSFISILIMNKSKILKYGCPVGTLCSELAKLEHDAERNANELFLLFKQWLTKQFEQLGFASESEYLALHLLGRSQGVAVMANTFCDEYYIKSEVDQINHWLDNKIQYQQQKAMEC